jgi:hypothetical protein
MIQYIFPKLKCTKYFFWIFDTNSSLLTPPLWFHSIHVACFFAQPFARGCCCWGFKCWAICLVPPLVIGGLSWVTKNRESGTCCTLYQRLLHNQPTIGVALSQKRFLPSFMTSHWHLKLARLRCVGQPPLHQSDGLTKVHSSNLTCRPMSLEGVFDGQQHRSVA